MRSRSWLTALRAWIAGAPPAPSAPPVRDAPPLAPLAAWVPPGAPPVEIAGVRIAGGMIYVGERLPPVAEPCDIEPALIDPRLPVDRAPPALLGATMSCWPAYVDLSPEQRGAYLAWLADGRRDPGVDVGYVFLFLYGLERRLLDDARRAPLDPAEQAALEAEILALRDRYGGRSASFRGYAAGLLGAMWMQGGEPVYARLPPPTEPRAGELPLLLRLGLGQLLRDGRPIPADWALAWAWADPERGPASSPSAARRDPEALRERFRQSYAAAFGEGLTRVPEGRELRVHYRPASASFGGGLVLEAPGVPDVAPLREPVERIRQILERCGAEPGA